MKGFDYNVTLIIFFVSYAGVEPITNLVLKRLSPRVFFTATILLSGLMMMCMGFVQNTASLLVVRFMLGLAEAGLFPGKERERKTRFLANPRNRGQLLPFLLVQKI